MLLIIGKVFSISALELVEDLKEMFPRYLILISELWTNVSNFCYENPPFHKSNISYWSTVNTIRCAMLRDSVQITLITSEMF